MATFAAVLGSCPSRVSGLGTPFASAHRLVVLHRLLLPPQESVCDLGVVSGFRSALGAHCGKKHRVPTHSRTTMLPSTPGKRVLINEGIGRYPLAVVLLALSTALCATSEGNSSNKGFAFPPAITLR